MNYDLAIRWLTCYYSLRQLQAVSAAQRASQDNRGAGADVHPDVAAAGVGAGGAHPGRRRRQRALHRRLGRPPPLRLAGVHHPHGRAELPQHAQSMKQARERPTTEVPPMYECPSDEMLCT